jgi:hypothetical protein
LRKFWIGISLLFILGCEKIVIIDLPPSQNLIVVEGWLTDIQQTQSIRLTQSNGFLTNNPVQSISDANVRVERKGGGFQLYSHSNDGYYISVDPFLGNANLEYRVIIELSDGVIIQSDWDKMPVKTDIDFISTRSFLENDPENPGEQITLYYPKLIARDSANVKNFYRWVFFKDRAPYSEPESITLQNDRFFDGNLIPNNFDEFSYQKGDSIIVNLQSLSRSSFDFLTLLKSQIATLGSSSISTPAVVDGNMKNITNSNERVLGYFGTASISADTIIAQ